MAINVAFYSDALTSGRYGLGRYACELFRSLRLLAPAIQTRPVSAQLSPDLAPSRMADQANAYVRVPWPRKVIASLWSTVQFPRIERWTPWADVVHCVELDYPVATRRPLVVTVHDIGPLTDPEYFSASHPFLLKRAIQSAREKAAAIICVSRATADAVESYLGCSLGDRLVIIPEGVSAEFFLPPNATIGREREGHGPRAPYFLWVGSLNPRKNLERVLKAFELIADDVPQNLVVAGGTAWDSDRILRAVQQSPIGHRVHLRGRVTDAQLRRLYRGASAFVFVSLMEGFGLPILEAMASGCPVVTSNISSMPEVAGDAAIQVDPASVEDIAQCLRRVGLNTDLRRDLSRRGAARAAQFSWNSCANAVAEIYRRVQAGRDWASSVHRQRGFVPPMARHTDLHETKFS